jgi:hypothetical protein
LEQALYQALDDLGVQSLEPPALNPPSNEFEQRADLSMATFDRLRRKLIIAQEVARVRFHNPTVGFDDALGFWWGHQFDLDQIVEKVFERAARDSYGGITLGWIWEMGEIGIQKSIDMGLAQLIKARHALLQQEAVELATFGEHFTTKGVRVALGLEVSGEAVEMRPEQSASEIDQGPFFFEPVFEHKSA